ncbi:unnamed protein product [Urochloa humidicola]
MALGVLPFVWLRNLSLLSHLFVTGSLCHKKKKGLTSTLSPSGSTTMVKKDNGDDNNFSSREHLNGSP